MEHFRGSIKANGGAASVWERHTGPRVVLCRNGKVLTAIGPRLGSAVAALSGTAKKRHAVLSRFATDILS